MSVFNLERSFLYIHVPRTAGSSMEQAPFMKRNGEIVHGHIPYFQYETAIRQGTIGINWEKIYKFAFVREPLDRFVSSFEYAKALGIFGANESFEKVCNYFGQMQPMRVKAATVRRDDQAIVKNAQQMEGMMFNLFMPQYFFLIDSQEQLMPNIYKYENLEEGWGEVCDRIGEEFELPVLKKTQRGPSYWKPQTRKLVKNFYQQDYEFFYG